MADQRPDARKHDELRNITFKKNFMDNADGSCLVSFGKTQVICTATIEERVPIFLRNQGSGWVTAEYSMLPASTDSRNMREAAKGKQSGRTQEIQRLIGRSLRAAVDLKRLGERQIVVDCDVLNADGGTRVASICGGFVAMALAIKKHHYLGKYSNKSPIIRQVAAISCGVVNKKSVLDLNYDEDSRADVDGNFVMDASGGIIETQITAEDGVYTSGQLFEMLKLATDAIKEICALQKKALG